jgi:hypothetical protein
VITVARIESELNCWFSPDLPVCSVLWLLGGPDELVPALVRLAGQLGWAECRVAACAPGTRPSLFPAVAGQQELLRAEFDLAGSVLENTPSPILRHPLSKGSVCEVVSAEPAADGVWQALATARGLRACAGLFQSGGVVPDAWVYSAMRLVMIAGTIALDRGAGDLGVQDALLHGFLADSLQGGGLAITRVFPEYGGSGVALTGSPAAIDEAQWAFATAAPVKDADVRHSMTIGGPWSPAPGWRAYEQSPENSRWIPA